MKRFFYAVLLGITTKNYCSCDICEKRRIKELCCIIALWSFVAAAIVIRLSV